MPARQRKRVTISTLIPFLVFILFFSMMIWQKYRTSHEIPATPHQRYVETNRSVTLFFAADGTRLAREVREIEPCEGDDACLKSTLDELLNGPVGELEETVPEGATVDTVRITGNQATIEFNNLFSDALPSGSSAEMLAVYSVVNTIAFNFPQIQKIKLNVDGNADVKLRHLDLANPLSPDYSLEILLLSPEPEKVLPGSAADHKGVPK